MGTVPKRIRAGNVEEQVPAPDPVMMDSREVAGSPPAWFAQAFGQLSEEILDVKREMGAARAELATSKSNQVTLKQAGLQKQFDVNQTVLDGVEGALIQLRSGHDAAAYLAKCEATLTLRQKHLRIADAYDWKTVEVYENGVLGDGMADDKRIAEVAATARRIAARPDSTWEHQQRNVRTPCQQYNVAAACTVRPKKNWLRGVRRRRRSSGLCYACGQVGYMARVCPSQQRSPQQHQP